jgi:hypothetical protein
MHVKLNTKLATSKSLIMKRYLQQLRLDIQQAAILAPLPEEAEFMVNLDDDEPIYEPAYTPVTLPVLLGIEAESFPPSAFLTERQMEQLIFEITNLWRAFRLYWVMPPNLSLAQQYSAMHRAMKEEVVLWQSRFGGVVRICQYEFGGFCPSGDSSNCYCKLANEAAQRDLELWEEHVRSQGIDPYEELSEEAGAAFQAESKRRAFLKRIEEDWSDLWLDDTIKNLEGNFPAFLNSPPTDPEATDSWLGFIISDNDNLGKPENIGLKNDLNNPPNDFFNEDFLELNA